MVKRINKWLMICVIITLSCNNKNGVDSFSINVNDSVSVIIPSRSLTKQVYVKGGSYKPFYGSNDSLVKVKPFLIDEHPVTNGAFLNFVKANPQWRRSAVQAIFADSTYLHDWVSDTILPKNANSDAPITYISWFAAKAFAASVGKRLPTLDEWEFVAMANETTYNARKLKSYSDDIVNLYLIKDKQYHTIKQSKPNYWGVYNMFDLIWEWTDDFNSVLITGDSRDGGTDDKGLFCAGAATNATDILNYAAFMRFGFRSSLKANYTISNLGFRCVKDTSILVE
ncbi:MAG: formylglycine-generating enzyme family protein [Niabella sp.]